MFIRAKTFKDVNGNQTRRYYYIVEGYTKGDKVKQRVVRYIGTIDSLMKKLDLAEKILKKSD